MIDIQSPTLAEDFYLPKATIGVVGHGYIGKAYRKLFDRWCATIAYDKYLTEPGLSTLDEVVSRCELIFVGVPTPMKANGECHTDIVESVLHDISESARRQERGAGSFIVVIKSTVPPGFTDRIKKTVPLRIVFSPEFLTEKNWMKDIFWTSRVILGGDKSDTDIVSIFMKWAYTGYKAQIVACEPLVAEMVKLSTNAHLMTRVLLANELYLICHKLGVDYDKVKTLTQLDERIGSSHMNVPGPDGQLGAGGQCFPKDISNLRFVAAQLGIPEKIFTAVYERNLEIRDDHDWQAMKGRAVIDE